MPRWTYKITINNCLDRALELVSSSVPWGICEKEFPKIINAGEVGEFSVYSPAGAPWGIEFYFSMRDKVNKAGEKHYGSLQFSVDVPYWKHENKSSFKCTGILTQNGFKKIPDGNHDFSTVATITASTCNHFLPQVDLSEENDAPSNHNNIYDWAFIQQKKAIDPDEQSINDFIPDKNIFSKRKIISRTEKYSISKSLWAQIKDKKYRDDYSKQNFVKDYFIISAYEIRKNLTINIAANQSYGQTRTVTNQSTIRRETSEDFQIENTINCESKGEKISLSENLRMQYQISRLNEYCDEESKSVQEVFSYNSVEQDRDIVLWDLTKVLILYRVDSNDEIELVGIGDYFVDSIIKTYIYNSVQENDAEESTMEENLLCANSENNFCLNDLVLQEMFEEGYGAPIPRSRRCQTLDS